MKFCPVCNGAYFDTERFCPQDGTPLRTHESPGDLVGTIVAQRYHVTGKLGEGGMGQVYLAEHVRMKRKVALKVLPPRIASDADAISRFNREASNAGQIEHPNVAAIYDFGESDDGIVYLAMEYVEGESLARVLATHGALPPIRAADIGQQVAAALDAAHRLGFVHRDLKPDNILVGAHHDGRDKIKVVDFGISKVPDAKGQTVTHSGVVIGTPDFMSPEQLAGDVVDSRSDIYSLGIVAFNLLTGQLPFQGKDGSNAVLARLTDPPLRLVDVKPDGGWSIDVQRVLDRALHIDRDHRFASASHFGAALVDAVAGLPKLPTMSLGATGILAAPTTNSMSTADLSMIEARLMSAVGPIARVLVKRAAAGAPTREALIAALAAEIDDEHERDQFRGALK
jgi:serine/threonine protein kinase